MDRVSNLTCFSFDLYAVTQKFIDFPVVAIERAVVIFGFPAQEIQCPVDLGGGIAAFCQPGSEQTFLDVAVAGAVGPIAEVP
jgi:hypothetical protein